MQKNTGKSLEEFVASVERYFVSRGTHVDVNKKVYMDGVQIAEYDVVVTARIGSGEARWLIECRDRPSQGAAGVEWINQLPSRKQLGRFHKVTAVSTTGFSPAAILAAQQFDVELRTVSEVQIHELASWLQMPTLPVRVVTSRLVDVGLTTQPSHDDPSTAMREPAEADSQDIVLMNKITGSVVALPSYVDGLCRSLGVYDQCPAGSEQTVEFGVDVQHENLLVLTNSESHSLAFMEIAVVLTSREVLLSYSAAKEYKTVGGDTPHAQVLTFEPADLMLGDIKVGIQNFKVTRLVGAGNLDQ